MEENVKKLLTDIEEKQDIAVKKVNAMYKRLRQDKEDIAYQQAINDALGYAWSAIHHFLVPEKCECGAHKSDINK